VGDVALLSDTNLAGRAPLTVFDDALERHALMFHVRGDSNGRHHAPYLPLLDFTTGVGLLVGLGLLLLHWRDWRSLFLLAALAITVAPSLLAVNGPHAMRSIGAAAVACLIAAFGWMVVIDAVLCRVRRVGDAANPGARRLLTRQSLAGLVLALALLQNVWTYFIFMAEDHDVWTAFYPIHTRMGVYLREVADERGAQALEQVYVAEDLTENDVLRYLAHGLPVATFDDTELSRPVEPGALFVFSGYSYETDAAELAPYLADEENPVLAGPPLPGTERPSFVVYRASEQVGEQADQ
jgi:hypothetical protein